ncbi:hypothetical protein ACET3Z_019248 [Daucus carota]
MVKINVHSCFLDEPLPNGNISGIGVGAHLDRADLVQQLNQRKADPNVELIPTLCDPNANELAAYLALHGAQNYKCMVIISQPFGEIFEFWSRDMGLGSAEPRFIAVHEDDLNPAVVDEEDVAPVVEDGVQENAADEEVEVIEIDD